MSVDLHNYSGIEFMENSICPLTRDWWTPFGFNMRNEILHGKAWTRDKSTSSVQIEVRANSYSRRRKPIPTGEMAMRVAEMNEE